MKRSVYWLAIGVLTLGLALCFVRGVLAQNFTESNKSPDKDILQSICPKTLMKESCKDCHTFPDWQIKEANPDRFYDYPISAMCIKDIEGKKVGHLLVESIFSVNTYKFFNYLDWHGIKYAIIEINSYGGDLFEAIRMAGLMENWQKKGNIVETRVHSIAASGGFIVMVSGSEGYRFVDEFAQVMWHELWTLEGMKVSTPSSKEEAARVLRHIQNTVNEHLAKRAKLSVQEINDKIRGYSELWMTGRQAVEYGFADGFIE